MINDRVRVAGVFGKLKAEAAQGLKLPKDVVLGELMISFVGRYSVKIENYRGILIYDDQTVKLQAKHCRLQIYGKRLRIDYYDHDEMKISGQIRGLEFGD